MNELAKTIHDNNKKKGFYDTQRSIPELIALIHSEASEALEADREGRFTEVDIKVVLDLEEDFQRGFELRVKNTFEDEIADTIIRLLDLCGYKGIDIESHILAKVAYNKLRPYKHGKKY